MIAAGLVRRLKNLVANGRELAKEAAQLSEDLNSFFAHANRKLSNIEASSEALFGAQQAEIELMKRRAAVERLDEKAARPGWVRSGQSWAQPEFQAVLVRVMGENGVTWTLYLPYREVGSKDYALDAMLLLEEEVCK